MICIMSKTYFLSMTITDSPKNSTHRKFHKNLFRNMRIVLAKPDLQSPTTAQTSLSSSSAGKRRLLNRSPPPFRTPKWKITLDVLSIHLVRGLLTPHLPIRSHHVSRGIFSQNGCLFIEQRGSSNAALTCISPLSNTAQIENWLKS